MGGKHFALSGFGIADFVWIACREVADGIDGSALTLERLKVRIAKHQLTAFEMKLTDWRKGLSQAYRYGFFADRAILVLPSESADSAVKSKSLFQQLGVSLWSFDTETKKIRKLVVGRSTGARDAAARTKAVDLICRRFNLRKARK